MKKTIQWLIIAIIILAAGFGGWYWWQKVNQDKVVSSRYNADDYQTSNSDLFPDVHIEQDNQMWDEYQVSFQYPQTKNDKVNKDIKGFVDKTITDFKTEAEKRPQVNQWDDELHGTFTTSGLAPNVLSVKFMINEFFTDNSDPVHDLHTMLYGLEKGESFVLADIFEDDSDYLEKISGLITEELQEDDSVTDKSKIDKAASAKDGNFDLFTLDEDSVEFYFEEGVLADSSMKVDIHYSEVSDILAPFIKTHLDSDDEAKDNSDTSKVTPTPAATPAATPTPAPSATPSGGGGTCSNPVALTFDDGPHKIYTPQKLDVLKEKGVSATFFMVGNLVGAYPDIVKRIYNEGHELGNHTWDHAQLTRISAVDIKNEISRTQDAIKQAAGVSASLMRPPYGAVNETVKQNVGLPIILWSVDPDDWKDRVTDTVVQRVVAKTSPGDIVLMHDIYKSTADAVPIIIDQLKAKGYCFVTVSELLGLPDETSVDAGKVYSEKK